MLRRSIRSPSVPLDCVHRLTDAVKRGFSYSGSTQTVGPRSKLRTNRVPYAHKRMVALGRDPPARASICTDLPAMNQRHTDGLPLHAQELVVRSPRAPIPQTGELKALCAPFRAEVDDGLRFTQAARTRSIHTERWRLKMWFLDRRQWPPQVLGQCGWTPV